MKKTLTAIVMTAALGLGMLGCGNSRAISASSANVEQKVVLTLPKNAGEPVSVGMYRGMHETPTEYVVCKNADGTLTMYFKSLESKEWIQRDYQK